jgi:hypothetical protein
MGVEHVGVIAGQVVEAARAVLSKRSNTTVLSLTDRAFQEREAYTRAALLAEEAAIEIARVALGTAPA